MREGKQFEADFKESVPEGIYFLRLKDVFSGTGNEGRSFTPKNPCDSIMYKCPILFLLEFKSSKGTSFSFSEKIIKKNQIRELTKASKHHGIIPGFIFNFRKYALTYFVHIEDFNIFKETCGKKSINEKDCKEMGILIEQHLKQTKYHYNINKFTEEVEFKYYI